MKNFRKIKEQYFAVVKNVEIIGEAAYKLTLDFKESNPVVDWQVVVNMRHVLVHGYYNIDPQVLWDTVNNDLPTFRIQIQSLMEKSF